MKFSNVIMGKRNLFFLFSFSLLVVGGFLKSVEAKNLSIDQFEERVKDKELLKKLGVLTFRGEAICTVFASGKNQMMTSSFCLNERYLHEYAIRIASETITRPILKAKISEKSGLATLKVDKIDDFFFLDKKLRGQSDHEEDESGGNLRNLGPFKNSISLFSAVNSIGEEFIQEGKGGELIQTPIKGIIYHTFNSGNLSGGAPFLYKNKVIGVHLGFIEHKLLYSKDLFENSIDDSSSFFNLMMPLSETTQMSIEKLDLIKDNSSIKREIL